MTREYQSEWEKLRSLRRRIVKIAFAGVAIIALVPLSQKLPRAWAVPLGFAVFAAWVVLIILFYIAVIQHRYWSCPRCGQPFHFKYGMLGRISISNPFAGRCLHCGLPKWAETDPDPKLKHDFDPFRTDRMLGLGGAPRRS